MIAHLPHAGSDKALAGQLLQSSCWTTNAALMQQIRHDIAVAMMKRIASAHPLVQR